LERHPPRRRRERLLRGRTVRLLPASWQDTGSGVFTLAAATLVLGFGPLRRATALSLSQAALACGLAAFLVDVYLY
jgi:hypothetical protein